MLPSLLQLPAVGVRLTNSGALSNLWKISTESPFLTTVKVEYTYTFGGKFSGTLAYFVLDFEAPGMIMLRPAWLLDSQSGRARDHDRAFELCNSNHPFDSVQLQTAYNTVKDYQANNGREEQLGLDVFKEDNMTQIVQAAQLIVMQRVASAISKFVE